MDTLLPAQSTTFYEQLKNNKELDIRDNRGKTHCLGLVLLGVLIGLYRNRDGSLSSIHRSMLNTHKQLCAHLQIAYSNPVSRAQLPLILKRIDVQLFSTLLFSFSGIELVKGERQWFAGDGKELRGSIIKGDVRGEVVVQFVSHAGRWVYNQLFIHSHKESERPCIRKLLMGELGAQKITLDALHCIPETVKQIEKQGGIYVVGLKENQRSLYADIRKTVTRLRPVNQMQQSNKAHGRIDKRVYKSYCIERSFLM